ncbi:MAG: phosphoribosylformylglycinamidine synthase subunit PurS [Leptospira sp.]|nr:phosphoribosylformylglycinamidine synthase subunit PurS [Leptospira sp.]
MFIGKINITLKESVLDPQGNTVKKVLNEMGESAVSDVRIGKYIELKLNSKNIETARADVSRLCEKLLVNGIIETYTSEVLPV